MSRVGWRYGGSVGLDAMDAACQQLPWVAPANGLTAGVIVPQLALRVCVVGLQEMHVGHSCRCVGVRHRARLQVRQQAKCVLRTALQWTAGGVVIAFGRRSQLQV